MDKIEGFAAKESKKPLESYSYEPKKLGPDDVLIDITHCGICHSDIHLIDNDWGVSKYPFIPGHEIIGRVKEVGSEMAHMSKGTQVGVGWQAGSCSHCEFCVQGHENVCLKNQPTCVGRNGGFAKQVVVDGRFVFPIPPGMNPATTAPLLCGGVTVFSPLFHHGVGPHTKLAIIGSGGLGHMAIQFAKAFGADVTVFSTSEDKEEEARKLGADDFNPKKRENSFDFIISTIPADQDWMKWIALLKPKGKFCFVGASPGPIQTHAMQLISKECELFGSAIGSPATIREMLKVAKHHHVEAIIEEFPIDKVNDALDRVRSQKIRYRAVLKM